MYDAKSGHVGEGEFWSNGRVQIWRHCDGVFELRHNGEQVMPIGSFEKINWYLWAEFTVL